MTGSKVAFIANTLESAYKFRRILSDLGMNVVAGSTMQLMSIMKSEDCFGLLIFEAIGKALSHMDEVKQAVEGQGVALLAIVDERNLADLDLSDRVPSDFVVDNASSQECATRIMRLLGSGVSERDEKIAIDNMVINLSTYQVTVGGDPVDLTYLEYALLAFLARNPSRAFTRDVLLQEVWGFDYLGGSRTVDVHVRRIRAKLGPGLAQHLETIRGVGYLWDPIG